MSRQVTKSYFPNYSSSRRVRRTTSDQPLPSMVSDDVSSVHSSELGFSIDSSIHTSKYGSSDDEATLESYDDRGRRRVHPKMSLTSTKSSIPPWAESDVTSIGASTLDYTIESKRGRESILAPSESRGNHVRGSSRRRESRFVSRSKSLGSRFSRSVHSRIRLAQKTTMDDAESYKVSLVDTDDYSGYEVSPRRGNEDREIMRSKHIVSSKAAETRMKHVRRNSDPSVGRKVGRSKSHRSSRRAESRPSTPTEAIDQYESYDNYEVSPVNYGYGSGYEISPSRSEFPDESSTFDQSRSPIVQSRSSRSSNTRAPPTSPSYSHDEYDSLKISRTDTDDYKTNEGVRNGYHHHSGRTDKSVRSCRSGQTKSETDHSTSIDELDGFEVKRADTRDSVSRKTSRADTIDSESPSIEKTRSTWSGVIWARRSETEDDQESYAMSHVARNHSAHSRTSELSRHESNGHARPKKIYSSHSRRSETSASTSYGVDRPQKTYSSHSRYSEHSCRSKSRSKSESSSSRHQKGKHEATSEPRLRNVDYMSEVDIASNNQGLSTVAPIGKEEAKEAFHHEIPHMVPIPTLGDDISSIGNTRNYEFFSRQLVKVEPRIDEEAGGFEQAPKKVEKGVLSEEDKNRLEYFFVGVICVSLLTLIGLLALVVMRK